MLWVKNTTSRWIPHEYHDPQYMYLAARCITYGSVDASDGSDAVC